jgi:outer membrane protein OmpA-like peptidoglycan-associated protein
MRTAIGALSVALLGLLVYYGAAVAGPDIQKKVEGKARAAAANVAPGVEVKLDALDAVVTGQVATQDLRDEVIKTIKRVEGVRKVSDRLEVAGATPPAAPPAEPEVAVVDTADAGPTETDVAVAAVEDVVDSDASDDVVDPDAADDVADDATADAEEADVGPADVEVVPEPELELPAPFRVSVAWDGRRLTLAGDLAPPWIDQLNTLILKEFPADDVVGEFKPTALKPTPGFDKAARSLLRMLAKAQSGSVELLDKSAKATLVMKDEATKKLVLNTFAAGVGPVFKRTFDITVAAPPAPVEPPKPAEPPPTAAQPAVSDPGGALDAAQCQALVNQLLEGEQQRFTFTKPTSSRLSEAGLAKAKQVAAVLKRCPTVKGRIEGYHHNQGDPDQIRTLTHKRAFAVHQALVAEGIEAKRFKYLGAGYNFPKHPNTLATRHLNERVEIKLGVD